MTNLQQEILKEFEELIGEAPEVLKMYEKEICFVCGQPFNKSKQFNDLKQFLLSALQRQMEAVDKCIPIRPSNNGDFMKGNWYDGFDYVRSQLLTNLEKI
jgi:hypothetical protein